MEPSVLFFDSFFHSNEQAWLDMVKFNQLVKITEIRIVPNDSIVRVGFMLREGRTKPEEIELDFYVRDVEKPDAATFVDIGAFDFSDERSSHFSVEKRVSTDVLLVKGTYKCLTIAVIGFATNPPNHAPAIMRHNAASMMPPMGHDPNLLVAGNLPSLLGPSAMNSEEAGGGRYGNQQGRYQQPSSSYVKRGIEPSISNDDVSRPHISIPPPAIEVDDLCGGPDCTFDDLSSRLSGLEDIASVDNFSAFVPQEIATMAASTAAGSDSATKTTKSGSAEEKVAVSSWLEKAADDQQGDEEFIDTVAYYQQEHEQLAAIVAAAAVAQQGVGQHQLSGIGSFNNPSSTAFEIAVAKFSKEQAASSSSASSSSPPKEAQKLLSLVEELLTSGEDTQQPREGMVKTLEQACQVLTIGLAYWHVYSEETFADLLDSLCEWAVTATDYVKAVKIVETSPLFKVRALKAGLHLLCEVLSLSPDCARRVLTGGRIQQHLVELLAAQAQVHKDQQHDGESGEILPLLTSPLENLVVETIFHTCIFEQGASIFVDQSKTQSDSIYLKFLMWLVEEKRKSGRRKCMQRRCFEPVSLILKSISVYEMLILWRSLVSKLLALMESGDAANSADLIEQICVCYEWCASTWLSVSSSKGVVDNSLLMSLSRHLKSMKLIDVVLVLQSEASSIFSRESRRRISSAISTFLEALSSTKSGLLFLLCDGPTVTQLIREIVMLSGHKLQQIGIDLSYRLLMLQLLDQLTSSTSGGSDKAEGQHIIVLRTLAGLVGRQHCVLLLAQVIASDKQHVDMLLRIAEANLSTSSSVAQETPAHGSKHPVEVEYILLLLLALVRNVPSIEPFKPPFGERVTNICKLCGDDFAVSSELRSVLPFAEGEQQIAQKDNPFEMTRLCDLLKQLVQPLVHDTTRIFSPSLQATLLLIWHSVKSPKVCLYEDDVAAIDRHVALAALWNNDIFAVVIQVLQAASQVRIACVQRTCYPPPVQQQMLYSLVDCAVNILTTMIVAIGSTGVVLVDVDPLVAALLSVHTGFCAIPPSSSLCLSDAAAVHKDVVSCLQEIILLPTKVAIATKPPIQVRLVSEIIKQTLSLPLLNLSGLVLLADFLSVFEDTNANKLSLIRQTFAATFFVNHRSASCDLSRLLSALYVTDSPPLQSALFRFVRALASISRSAAVNTLRVALSLAIDNLAKVASSLRSTGVESGDSHSPDTSKSSADMPTTCFSGDFVSSPFYAACKALALVTHLMATSPIVHATLIGELAQPSSDRAGQPFRQIIPDLATVLAGCCRRIARLSPLCAVEFMLHGLDFYTQLVSPSFVARGGATRFLPLSALTTIAEASLRCLVGSKSSLSNALNESSFGMLSDGGVSPEAACQTSSVPSEVQQSSWRLLSILAEEREAAAIWAVTDAHSSVINQAVIEACEPIASGASSLDEDALTTLTEMVMALSSLANRPGCGQRVNTLICGSTGDSNPIEQLLHQLTMMDLFTGDGFDLAAAATADGASAGGANPAEKPTRVGGTNNIDSTGLTERLQQLVDAMKRPQSSNTDRQNESVPATSETDIGHFLEEVFAEAPLDPFDSSEQDGSDEPVRFWWLVAESVHDASCTVESSQRVRADLEAIVRRFCDSLDISAEIAQDTASLVDSITAPGRLGGAGAAGLRGRSTINTSRQMRRYVAPMRGRGWLGPPSGSGYRAPPPSLASLGLDVRGRAPNTSRPPSMHVDDFQRFEKVAPPNATGTSTYRGGYRGRHFDPARARGGGRGTLNRSPLLPTPYWRKNDSGDRGDSSGASKPGGNIIDELLALANDPVVMAASAISGISGMQGAPDLTSSMGYPSFLNALAQQQQSSAASSSTTAAANMEAFLKAAASSAGAGGGDASSLPPFPLPIPLQILPLLDPAELAKLAASIFDSNNSGGNNNNAPSSDENDSRQRSPPSGRRRRETERSSSHDSDYEQRESRHRTSSRR